jgi:hypothetical protein
MKEKDILKDYFNFNKKNQNQNLEQSYNFTPYSLELPQDSSPIKFKENSTNRNSYKKEKPAKNVYNNNIIRKVNLQNKQNTNILQEIKKIKSKLKEVNNKININKNSIETLKISLNKIKKEKNEKKEEIVNLLSNRESVDEIYKNYIDFIKSKNRLNKKNKRKKKEIKNPFENQDEDAFEILISEIKQIDLIKFIDQSMNLIEEILDNPKRQLKLELKEIINKSFSIFNKETNMSNFLDTYSIVSNFFLRISIFISNQSYGKYSETMINLLLRCLLKINSINVKNEELINYMNNQYKNEKNKLKEEINKLLLDNENMKINKILLEKKLAQLNNNAQNKNQNNLKDIMYINKRIKNNEIKKNILEEKLKRKDKKIYKEDFEGKNGLDEYYYFTENNNNKSNKFKNYDFNQFMKLSQFISSTEKKNVNNFEIAQRYSFKISQNEESNESKKYNTINFNENNKISNLNNFEYSSPQVKIKNQSYYRSIKQNNNMNTNEKGLGLIISDEKKKNKENKKILNFRFNNKKIITYDDIKKNMKFDLAKKIKYLDKVNKTSLQDKKNKLIYGQQPKMKRLFTTEKKIKSIKYNFFDIIQETNKLRNSSEDNNYNRKNKLTENNQLLRNIKEKKINGKFDISKSFTDIKKIKPLVKSDYTTNKKISYFINQKNKDKKNGAEISEKIKYNESDIFPKKNQIFKTNIIKNKKIVLNGGLINKNIKNDKINKIIKNKIELNKKQKINYKKNNIKISIKGKLGKQVKIKDNYYTNANSEIKISEPNILYKNENINSIEQNIKSNRSDYTKYINYDTNPNIKNKIFYNNEKITLIYK